MSSMYRDRTALGGKHGTPMAQLTETRGHQWQTAATTARNGVRAFRLVSATFRAKCLVRGWSRDGESNPGPAHYE